MIDFLALLLVNMTAGFVLLAWYVFAGLDDPDQKKWAPGFLVTGLIALVFGAYITMIWPLPGVYSSAFGEQSVLFGILFLAAGVCMAAGWNLWTLSIYAFFAGLVAVVLGVRFINLHLTAAPLLAGVGFIVSGLGGILAFPGLTWFKKNLPLRILVALMLLGAAGIWALTGYGAYWMHMQAFSGLGVHGAPMMKH